MADELPWYYLEEDKRKVGPLAPGSLATLIAHGKLSEQTLVWTPGFKEWRALGSVAALAAFLESSRATPPSAPAVPEMESPHCRPTPARLPRRAIARVIDLGAAALLTRFLIGAKYSTDHWFLTGVAVAAIWIPIESFCLFGYSTSPGKWLSGLTVTSREGTWTPTSALSRTVNVSISGLGAYFAPALVLRVLVQLRNGLATGRMTYDSTEPEVLQVRISGARAVAAWLIAFALLASVYSAVFPPNRRNSAPDSATPQSAQKAISSR